MKYQIVLCAIILSSFNQVIGQCSPVIPLGSLVIADTTGLIGYGLSGFDVWVCKKVQVEIGIFADSNSIYIEEEAIGEIIGAGQTIWAKARAVLYLQSEGNTVYYDTNATVVDNAQNNTLIPCPNMIFDYSQAPAEGCDIKTLVKEVSISKGIKVYPNPNNGTFSINLNTSERVNLTIYNIHGQSFYQTTTSGLDKVEIKLPAQLSNGIYFLQVVGKGYSSTKKMAVKK